MMPHAVSKTLICPEGDYSIETHPMDWDSYWADMLIHIESTHPTLDQSPQALWPTIGVELRDEGH